MTCPDASQRFPTVVNDRFYRILGVLICVQCDDFSVAESVRIHWGQLESDRGSPDLTYSLTRHSDQCSINVQRDGVLLETVDADDCLYALETDATIEIQHRRNDLFFLHAAAAELGGRANLLVAESGGGKSTTLWGLLHHRWNYMSDELAPIDLESMQVFAYPRALSVKQRPPIYRLPEGTLSTNHSFHIAVDALPAVSPCDPCPLQAVYFIKYRPASGLPVIRQVSQAESGARLYANSLNQLAHANSGLDAAVRIATSVDSFELQTDDLAAACALATSHCRSTFDCGR